MNKLTKDEFSNLQDLFYLLHFLEGINEDLRWNYDTIKSVIEINEDEYGKMLRYLRSLQNKIFEKAKEYMEEE